MNGLWEPIPHREIGVMSKGIKTRLEKPTESADLNKAELMLPNLIAGKPE